MAGFYSTYPTQTVPAGGTITLSQNVGLQYRRVAGSVGGSTTSVTPFGTTNMPIDGTIVVLCGTNNTDTLTLVSSTNSKGANLNGNAVLRLGMILTLVWDEQLDIFRETSRNF